MESSFASSLNDQNFQLSASKMLRPRQPLRAVSTPVTRLEIIGSLDVPRSPPQYAARPPLLDWSFLAPWQQDNHYILTGYRVPSHSYRGSIQSLFYLHNEFVNIHSHMLGAFVFLGIFLCLYAFTDQPIDMADVVVFACFALGAIYCLSISATFHLLMNHSPSVCCFMNQLDYVGIAALITGSFVPSMYYGFYCEPLLRKSYLTMISTIGIGCTIVSTNSEFRTPSWRTFRACMFLAMGLSAILPVVHGVALLGAAQMERQMALSWVILQGSLYVIGAIIYAARIPERFNPGKYDIWGSSHQIFHFLILMAIMSHLVGVLKAFHYNKSSVTCGPNGI